MPWHRSGASGDVLATPVDPVGFRRVLGRYATGIAVVTTITAAGAPAGMAVSSFASVSLHPPLVGFCAGRQSRTWPHIQAAGYFGVSILRDGQAALSHRFATPIDDKFGGVGWHAARSGAPILDDALAWLDCALHDAFDAGDHMIVLGQVLELDGGDGAPLLHYRGRYGSFQPAGSPGDLD